MSLPHAAPAEVLDVRPLGAALKESRTTVLAKTDSFEAIRIVLPAGKQLPPHRVEGDLTVQCLEGRIIFQADGADHELAQGQMLYLKGGTTHALRALEDASVLATILLR